MNNPADTLAALAPCPFCGGADIRKGWDDFGWFQVFCGGCGATVEDDVPEKSIAAWNRRASLKGEAVVPALEVFRVAGGDVECCPNPTAAEAMDCLRDLRQCYDESLATPPAPQAVGENAGDIPDIGELTPERIEYLAGAVNAAWCKSDMMVRAKRCQQAAQALRMLAAKLHPTPSPAQQGGGEAEVAYRKFMDACSRYPVGEVDFRAAFAAAIQANRNAADVTPRLVELVNEYEYEHGYTPNERERMLLLDFAMGLPAELFATPPAQQPGEVVTDEMVGRAALAMAEKDGHRHSHSWYLALTRHTLEAALAPKESG